jgi:hypothetical protein
MDINVIEWKHHKTESVNKLREALYSEVEFVGGGLSRQGFRNTIKRFLKEEKSRLKTKYLVGHTECLLHMQPRQWEALKECWAVDGQVLKAAKMAIAWKHVKNVSSTGRKGNTGLEAQLVYKDLLVFFRRVSRDCILISC